MLVLSVVISFQPLTFSIVLFNVLLLSTSITPYLLSLYKIPDLTPYLILLAPTPGLGPMKKMAWY